MKVEYHPSVRQNVAEALRGYDAVSKKLGEEFNAESRHRANLKRFPYHFLFKELPDGIRVMLVRHHRRHPDFGVERG